MQRPDTSRALTHWMAVLLAIVLAVGLGSAAQAYPPKVVVLDVSERTMPPSTPFIATVTGCTPGEDVTFYLVDNDPVTVICGTGGIATTPLNAPKTPGRYDVTAVLEDGTVLTVSITVTPASGSIPRTGTDATSATLMIGVGLALFGAAFLAVARLRRRDRSSALA